MRLKNIYTWFIFVVMLMFSSACHTEYCRENMYIQAVLKLYNYKNQSQAVNLSGVSVYTMDGSGNYLAKLPIDTVASTLRLVLNPESDTSRFRIVSNYINNEELVVVHKNTPEFVSAECGCRVKSIIDTVYVANLTFQDSISIVNHIVDDVYENENIQIFLRIGE